MNESFQSVFTKKTNFVAPKMVSQNERMKEVQVGTRNQETVGRPGC